MRSPVGALDENGLFLYAVKAMRPLLLAVILTLTPAAFGADMQADWRKDGGVDDRVKQALQVKGWRLEDDGRALDPKTKIAATKPVLEKAVLDLKQDARRAALETVNAMLSAGKPLDLEQLERVKTLAPELPPALAKSLLDPKSDVNAVRAMAASELDAVAGYFDGGRTLADRREAAQPVTVPVPGPRVDLPYHTAAEKAVGEKLRASAQAEIGKDPFGKTVLARLNVSGKTDLPPVVIENQNSGVVAQYDYHRGTIVLDRASVLDSVVGAAAPAARAALRKTLEAPGGLLAYLDAHPDAVTTIVKDNDVVLVHELTHAWQDKRDPIFREMARGNIPDSQPLEYEEEAYKTKNLYLRSKLKNDPASVKMDAELNDYLAMTGEPHDWKLAVMIGIADASPSRALPIADLRSIEQARLERTKNRTVVTSDDQQGKAFDLQALTRGGRLLSDLDAAHAKRMTTLDAKIAGGRNADYKLIGSYYLVQALHASRAPDRAAYLDQAELYAGRSGNKALIEEVRTAKAQK